MRVEFLERFSKDIDRISLSSVKKSVERLIRQIESAESLEKIPQVKKLTGFKSE